MSDERCDTCGRPWDDDRYTRRYGAVRRGPFRLREGRKVLGVCGGIADHFGWQRLWVRLAAVLALFACFLPVLIAYFIAAALMDSDAEEEAWRTA